MSGQQEALAAATVARRSEAAEGRAWARAWRAKNKPMFDALYGTADDGDDMNPVAIAEARIANAFAGVQDALTELRVALNRRAALLPEAAGGDPKEPAARVAPGGGVPAPSSTLTVCS